MPRTESMEPEDAKISGTDARNDRPIGIGPVVLMVLMLCLVVWILLSALSPLTDPDPSEHPAVGKLLPRLQLQPLVEESEPITLADLRGKVVVVNFWTTWCPNCRVDIPHVVDVKNHFRTDEDFLLMSVMCDDVGSEGMDGLRLLSEEYLESIGTQLTVYVDPSMTTRSAFDEIGSFKGYPTTIVLNREGVVQGVWVGYDPRLGKWLTLMVQNLLDAKR